MAEQAGKASALMGAMSNEKRLMILCQLVKGERSVNELAELLRAPQSTISQHLALLRREGFVQARREAQTQFYSLAGEEARAILETLQALYCDPQPEDAER
ncbi:MAG TPA: metalloregulator ArsR/SmtB family transcription factor [Gammaproteobacteria bacterium]|nr:metalloregulator ArsR/SmtB family transcription factor [Gammaproteobacteria bacterium]